MSARYIYGGADRHGNARTGVTFDAPADFARVQYGAGWLWLEILTDDEARQKVGAIEPDPATGRRMWWGEADSELPAQPEPEHPSPEAKRTSRCPVHDQDLIYDPDKEVQASGDWQEHWICPVEICEIGAWYG